MKKKTLLFTVILIVLSTLFTSCAKFVSIDKYLNDNYDTSKDVLNTHSVIFGDNETSYTLAQANSEFAVFSSTKGAHTVYAVFGMNAGKIVASFDNTTLEYTVKLFDDLPVFLVEILTKESANSQQVTPIAAAQEDNNTNEETEKDTRYVLYDAQGNEIIRTKHQPTAPFMLTHDNLIYDYTSYNVAEDGSLTKDADIPEYLMINSCDYYSDSHYYLSNEGTLTVLDKSFNVVLNYSVPSYVFTTSFYPLNNGDIFVQYLYVVDEDEEEFDVSLYNNYSSSTNKMNMVSLIISLDNGKQKEIDLDYYVLDITTCTELRQGYEESNNPYTTDFDNIATIAPITDTMLDMSEANCDVVYMSNKGKVGKSLKVLEDQNTDLPYLIGDDLYMVKTLSGSAIVDGDGKLVKSIQSTLEQVGTYFVGEKAIYNLSLDAVYNLYENDAKIIGSAANSVFVEAKTGSGYDVIMFIDGTHKTVCSYTEDKSSIKFELNEEFGYSIYDPNTKKYTYYNAKGDLLLESNIALSVVTISSEYSTVILKGTDNSYHTFKVN